MNVPHSTLVGRMLEQAARRADSPALTFLDAHGDATAYTFGRLFEEAQSLAERLRAAPVDTAFPVGILLQTQEAQVLHYLASLLAGVVPAILTPPNRKLNREYYAETMTQVLARSGFSAVLSDLDDIDPRIPVLAPGTMECTGEPVRPDRGEPVGPDISFMQFSSGTTGIKRGVLVTDVAVLAQIDAYAGAIGLRDEDVILSWLPLYHDMGFIACLNMPLVAGVHTVMLDTVDWVTDPALFPRAVTAYRATLSWNPNFAYAFMGQRIPDRQLPGLDLSSLRALVNCSEPVTHESQELFARRFRESGLRADVFTGCYAMAETVFALTHGRSTDPLYLHESGPHDDARREGSRAYVSVGRPLPGVELRIVEDGRDVDDRWIGELWARSPFNLAGYYRNPQATGEAFHGDWYRTGDLGYRVGDSYYVVGRNKDVLIISGVNVFPQDVEDLVGGVEGVPSGRVSTYAEFDTRLQSDRMVVLAECTLDGAEAREVSVTIRQRIQAAFHITGFNVHLVPPGWLVKSTAGKMARGANREKWQKERAQAPTS